MRKIIIIIKKNVWAKMYFGSLTFKNKLFGNPDVLAYLLVYCCAKQVNVA